MVVGARSVKFGVGQSVARVEDHRLLRGRGRFTDDIISGTDRSLGLEEVARIAFSPALRPPGEEAGLSRIGGLHSIGTDVPDRMPRL